MEKNEWLEQCRKHKEVLREIVGNYYPYRELPDTSGLEITAPTAQSACKAICKQIIEENTDILEPHIQFDAALLDGNVEKLHGLMQSTWFGVPESTSCWRIPGFKEMVDLLDDPAEE